MGQAKKQFYDGLLDSVSIDTKICAAHCKDVFINNFIKTNGTKGKCSYCNAKRNVVAFDVFYEVLEVGINYLFEDANESRFVNHDGEHGLDGNTFVSWDIVYDDMLELQIDNEEISKDIHTMLGDDNVYGRSDEFWSYTDQLSSEWNHFKQVVKHKARFVFYYLDTFKGHFDSNPIAILNDIQSEFTRLNLFKSITPATQIYRCTQHKTKDEVKVDGKRIASNPVVNCKGQNRMSPAGISMFYGSTSKVTSIEEVVNFSDTFNPFYTIACFTPKHNLKLIDLTNFPPLPSIFDADNNRQREAIMFLKAFAKDISQPVNTKDSSIEYVPTQVITEYIKFNPKLKVDGIIYPSAKDNSIANYVLFMDHEESLDKLKFHFNSIDTNQI